MKATAGLRLSTVSLALLALAGCNAVPDLMDRAGVDQGPYFTPVNHRGVAILPAETQRVAVLPVHGGSVADPESAQALDAVLLKALQQQQRFEVVALSREECHQLFGATDFASVAALPHGFLDKIAKRYAVDAVLFIDVTVYHAYRPLSLGFRTKLASVYDMQLIWAFDEVFSADDATMRNSVRRFYRRGDRSAPSDPLPSALQSPGRFGAVAADLMFRTLPPR
ncbi:MAG TPA: hypothetical protein VHN79_06150 [Lacunisphaera sp.]|nr:hypothetical protein [Lacunisphaera sp.]